MTESRKHLYFILFVVLLEIMSIGIIIPIYPKLLILLGGYSLSEAAIIGGYLVFIYAFMQFMFAPVLGNLSDQYGRKPIILIALFVFMLDYILLANAPSVLWLAVGRVIGGVAGSSITPAHAFLTDISTKENRAKYFGMLGAAIGVGFILGPALGGVLGEIDVRLPFWVAAGVMGVTSIIGYFILPESLAKDKRRKFEWKRANPIGALAQMGKYKWVLSLFAVFICMEMAGQAYPSVWTFFTIERFDWSIREVGYSLGIFGLFMAIVQGGLVGPAIARLGNLKTIYIGFAATIITFVFVSLVTNGWLLYAFMPIMALGGFAGVVLRTVMSYQVPEDSQGELQGALASISSIVAFTSPLMMTQIFGYFTSPDAYIYMPGAPYLAAAILAFLGFLLFVRVNRMGNVAEQDEANET